MKVALLQLRVSDGEAPEERWLRVERHLAALENQSVDLVVLPELWSVGFCNYDRYAQAAERIDGATVCRLSQWARLLHCHLLTGSFVESTSDGGRYNTMVLLDADGKRMGQYRKIHLFGYASREPHLLSAGTQTSQIATPFGVMGLATCYDLRFPEQFRRMVDNGAALFAVPAAWPQERLGDWRLFCQVRALENQCFLMACNHAGQCGGSIGAGHSMVVAPDGTILAEAGEQEQVLTVEMNLHDVQQFRNRFPALHDRVPL